MLYKFWRIFAGISWRIFLGTFFHKNEDKPSARTSAKKSGGPKIKIGEKSVLPKPDPNNCFGVWGSLAKKADHNPWWDA